MTSMLQDTHLAPEGRRKIGTGIDAKAEDTGAFRGLVHLGLACCLARLPFSPYLMLCLLVALDSRLFEACLKLEEGARGDK